METWPTLPQLARELGVADSTARRWTAAFPDLFPLRGRGAARRVHPQSREVLKRIQALYGAGFETKQITELLHREFPITVEVATISEGEQSAASINGYPRSTVQNSSIAGRISGRKSPTATVY